MTWLTEELRKECNYDPEGEGSVDDLIEYKNMLEDLVDRIDAITSRNARHQGHSSSADVMAVLFSMGFGKVTHREQGVK